MPRNAVPPDPERLLMIKTKACQRLSKEVAFYEQELKENYVKYEEMKLDSTRDKYDLKMLEQIVSESQMMVPDSKRRLNDMISDLSEFIMLHSSTDNQLLNVDGEYYVQAQTILKNNNNNNVQKRLLENNNVNDVETTNIDNLSPDEVF